MKPVVDIYRDTDEDVFAIQGSETRTTSAGAALTSPGTIDTDVQAHVIDLELRELDIPLCDPRSIPGDAVKAPFSVSTVDVSRSGQCALTDGALLSTFSSAARRAEGTLTVDPRRVIAEQTAQKAAGRDASIGTAVNNIAARALGYRK